MNAFTVFLLVSPLAILIGITMFFVMSMGTQKQNWHGEPWKDSQE